VTRPDLLDRDEDPIPAGERELQVVAIFARAAASKHPFVAGHAVVDMDDEVARRQAFEDVARDDAAERLGSADPDRPEELAIRDERDAVRTADEAAIEASLDERDRTRRRRLPHPTDDREVVAGFAEDLGESWRLVRCQDDPGTVRSPAVDGLDQAAGTAGRQDGFAPAEGITRRQTATGHRGALGRHGLPGQLEGSRGDEAALPVARR